uniref:Uncharacterized protein n=1 Tax=Lepeophtheirus salmonis TaxID=72036 RepID=A0A0K2SZM2_LEPSM
MEVSFEYLKPSLDVSLGTIEEHVIPQ